MSHYHNEVLKIVNLRVLKIYSTYYYECNYCTEMDLEDIKNSNKISILSSYNLSRIR